MNTLDFSSPNRPQIAATISHSTPPSCLAYHAKGKHLYVACPRDSSLTVINTFSTGSTDRPPLKYEQQGISQVVATHHEECVLTTGSLSTSNSSSTLASQKHAITYWSLYDHKVLRKFRGHTESVTHMSMSPADDSFLTSSQDGRVRLWNLQQAGCLAELELPRDKTHGPPCAVFDATGLVFAVHAKQLSSSSGHYIHLYDARNFGAGAFSEFQVVENGGEPPGPGGSSNSRIAFSQNGKHILLESGDTCTILDGYQGSVQHVLEGRGGGGSSSSCPSVWTPDDQAILRGTNGGSLQVWSASTGQLMQTYSSSAGQGNVVGALACNPKYAQLASASRSTTCLWLW